MSYLVTRIVRAARLPCTIVHRPAAKGILLALADDCGDDGGDAFTSVATLAREAEVSPSTVARHLDRLCAAGLIVEQHPPTQHRPRTWRLDLARVCTLADPAAVATLSDSDRQLVTTLSSTQPRLPLEPDSPRVATLESPDSPIGNPDTPMGKPDTPRVTTERYERYENEERTAPPAASRLSLATQPNGDNFHVIQPLAVELLQATGLQGGDLVDAVKQRCAELGIDYGRHAAVPFNVVHRACAWAELQTVKAKTATVRVSPRARAPTTATR